MFRTKQEFVYGEKKMELIPKGKRLLMYAYWNEEEPENHYWELYETMEEIIKDKGQCTEIYKADFIRMGIYTSETKLIRIKGKKKPKTKAYK